MDQKSKKIHEEDAPVNLWISSSYDGNSKELKIKVEGYYTSEVEDTEQYLNVAWIQNNILGPQNGSQTASGTMFINTCYEDTLLQYGEMKSVRHQPKEAILPKNIHIQFLPT